MRIRDDQAVLCGLQGKDGTAADWEECSEEGETCSVNRVGRLMRSAGLTGIPQCKRWRHKASGKRPVLVRNHLERNFQAAEPNTRWATDIA